MHSDKLLDAARSGQTPPISAVTGTSDGQGLVVELSAETMRTVDVAATEAQLESIVALPVTVREGEAPEPQSRVSDSDPWRGGALFQDPSYPSVYNFCSTAFAVQYAGGGTRLLSATHCDPTGNIAWRNGQGNTFTNGGANVEVKAVDDTMLINPVGVAQGKVYGGRWYAAPGDTHYSTNVGGAGSPTQGGEVCTSGANSGEHCELSVLDQAIVTWDCHFADCHGWRAQGTDPTIAATVGGDSGGPVYRYGPDGRAMGRGVISAGSNPQTPCITSTRRAVDNCHLVVWFIDLPRVLNAWNVSIMTLP